MERSKKCIKCRDKFGYTNEDSRWNYMGVTPVKIVKCPHCKCLQAIKFERIDNINTDYRYYQ